MGNSFYRGSEGCVLVFDLTDPKTFDSVETWRTEFMTQLAPKDPDNFPFVSCMVVSLRRCRTDALSRLCWETRLMWRTAREWYVPRKLPREWAWLTAVQISSKRAMTFCQSKGQIPYFETSAKEAINVEQAFEG